MGKPDYTLSINDLGNNLKYLASRYEKEVMVVEAGGEDTLTQNTYDMLVAVQQKVKAVPGGKGLGVVYWEPEGAKSWSKYGLSAWGDDGKPTKAMEAFLQ
jgi:arabinogalactan endo-1,4-beta-galactosidase